MEQQKIAQFLDHETAKIDRLIAKQEKLLDLLILRKQHFLERYTLRGDVKHYQKFDHGIPWVDKIPQHWGEIPLKYVARRGGDSFIDGDWVESPYIRDNGIRLIQTGNIGIGEYREQGFRYIDWETFYKLDCKEVFPGDILVSRLAEPVGRACITPALGYSMITAVDVCIIRPGEHVDANYVVNVVSTNAYLAWVSAISRGGTRDRISREQLGNIKIPFPPLNEQKRINNNIKTINKKIKQERTKILKAINLLQERKQALISAAVTGQIDVRDWEPPAAEAEDDATEPEAGDG